MQATAIIALIGQFLPMLIQVADGVATEIEGTHPAAPHVNAAVGSLKEAATHIANATNAAQPK